MEITVCDVTDIPELARLFVEMESYYFGEEASVMKRRCATFRKKFFHLLRSNDYRRSQ